MDIDPPHKSTGEAVELYLLDDSRDDSFLEADPRALSALAGCAAVDPGRERDPPTSLLLLVGRSFLQVEALATEYLGG